MKSLSYTFLDFFRKLVHISLVFLFLLLITFNFSKVALKFIWIISLVVDTGLVMTGALRIRLFSVEVFSILDWRLCIIRISAFRTCTLGIWGLGIRSLRIEVFSRGNFIIGALATQVIITGVLGPNFLPVRNFTKTIFPRLALCIFQRLLFYLQNLLVLFLNF